MSRALLQTGQKITECARLLSQLNFFPADVMRWILNHELNPVGARAIVPALKPLDYGIDDWWQHEAGLIEFQNEVIKYLYYRVKY